MPIIKVFERANSNFPFLHTRPSNGADTVVFSEDKTQVLLCKREDFRIWVLPGGNVEDGESLEQDALLPSTLSWTREQIADALAANGHVIERMQILPTYIAILLRIGIVLRNLRNKYILKHK